MIRIRRCTIADLPKLLPLIAEYWRFENIPAFDSERVASPLTRLITEEHLGAAWIALEGTQAVGYLLEVFVFSLEHAGLTAEIDEFYLIPGARGSGAGSELLRLAEAEARRMGCANISLQVGISNDPARAFYQRHGYHQRSGFALMEKTLEIG